MANFIVKGGKFLEGEIEVKGSKNAALPAMAASLLFKNEPLLQNLPQIEDIARMRELLEKLRETSEIDFEIAKKIRASILLVGPALARFGKITFPHPGGCVIGARPIDAFLDGWKAMGVNISTSDVDSNLSTSDVHNLVIYKLSAPNGLKGCDYTFRVPSVTGTEGLMMTAALASGKTILRNAAMEPEIAHLADFLNKNGANIKGAGTHTISIEGSGGTLLEARYSFSAPPDRIEAGSFLILGALLAKELLIKNFVADELTALTGALKEAGAEFNLDENFLRIKRSPELKAVNVKTKEYPGFATDLQAPFCILATQAKGVGMIHETIFEGRLGYAEDLNKMGAKITPCDPYRVIVNGPTPLRGRTLESPDIRAGLAFILAALLAEGESKIANIYQIDRGYEAIDSRLRAIGADIKRI